MPRPPGLTTNAYLAQELTAADLPAMATLAGRGYYNDFESPLAMPCRQLAQDLTKAGTPAALALRARAVSGDFDATTEEADAWANSPEGQQTFASLMQRPPGRRF